MIDDLVAVDSPHIEVSERDAGSGDLVRATDDNCASRSAVIHRSGPVIEHEAAESYSTGVWCQMVVPVLVDVQSICRIVGPEVLKDRVLDISHST